MEDLVKARFVCRTGLVLTLDGLTREKVKELERHLDSCSVEILPTRQSAKKSGSIRIVCASSSATRSIPDGESSTNAATLPREPRKPKQTGDKPIGRRSNVRRKT